MKKQFYPLLLVLALLLTAGLACGRGEGAVQGGKAGETPPVVQLLSPPNGTQVALGNQIYVQARAFARGGVGRIDFAVNGASVGTQSPASAQRLFVAAQAWTPPTAGTYTLAATAYDSAGQASAPVQVAVTVQESFPAAGGGEVAGEQPAASEAGGEPAGGQAGEVPPGGEQPSGGEASEQPSGGESGEAPSGGESGGQQPEEEAGFSVDFRADRTQVASGESTVLRWDVEGVREVYLDGQGVVGHGSREVWPFPPAQLYVLHVVLLSGEGRDYPLTVEVSGEYVLVSGPDLVVLAVDCPDTREADESVPFQAEVLNAGDEAAHGARWRWTIVQDQAVPGPWTPGDRFDLEPGETVLLRAEGEPKPAGTWRVHMDVQLDGEVNTGNNAGSDSFTVSGSQGGPDLAIVSVECSGFEAQSPGECGARFENRGDAVSPEATFAWIITPRGEAPGAFWNFGRPTGEGTQPGEQRGIDIFDLPALEPGDWTMHVRIDLDGDSDPGNNEGAGDFAVPAPEGGGQGSVPVPPANLRRAAFELLGSVGLEWDHDSANVQSFRVQRQGAGVVAETGSGETQASVDAPPCGTTYDFRVRACNAAGCSEPSNIVAVEGSCP